MFQLQASASRRQILDVPQLWWATVTDDSEGREYVSPDAYERSPDYYDHAEQRSRHRVISNGGGQL